MEGKIWKNPHNAFGLGNDFIHLHLYRLTVFLLNAVEENNCKICFCFSPGMCIVNMT